MHIQQIKSTSGHTRNAYNFSFLHWAEKRRHKYFWDGELTKQSVNF